MLYLTLIRDSFVILAHPELHISTYDAVQI